MKKKLQTIIASALVVAVAAVPVFANVTGLMTSTSTTMTTSMTTTTVPVEPVDPEKPEQKLPDGFIDLKDGLKADQTYCDEAITVGEDMPAKEVKTEFSLPGDEETYVSQYRVQGSGNPKPDGGAVPTTGAYVKVVPKLDGTFTAVVNQTNVKDVYFVEEGAAEPVDTFKTVANEVMVKSYAVEKGKTYYFYASGSKVMLGALGIQYTQKLPEGFVDLKDGLKADQTYLGAITVGEDMAAKEVITEFSLPEDTENYVSFYRVQGSTNPQPNGGKVPTAGAYVKVVPEMNGTFTVVVNQTNEKDVYFVQDGAEAPVDKFKTVKDEVMVKSYEVKKGETYYFYASGSKIMIGAIGIQYTQKLPEGFIDLKDGLKAGQTYLDAITVGEDMPAKSVVTEFSLPEDTESYTSLYRVQGSANPKPDGGKVPTAGAYVKVAPEKDGTFIVVVHQTNEKDVYFVQDGAEAPVDSFKTVKDEVMVKSYKVEKGKTYYFYASGSKVMIGAIGMQYADAPAPGIVAVTDITGVAAKMTEGETITLAGTVAPADATNKTIVWSIKDKGATEATLAGDKLTAKKAGKVVVTATIDKGVSADKAFTKDFTIEVEKKADVDNTVAVTGITGIATEMTAGETIALAGTVAPENATNKTIVWTVKDAGTTGATITGGNLTATAAGTVVITATIDKGVNATTAYTQDFTIVVKEAVKMGDVDGDGKITTDDALLILKDSLKMDLGSGKYVKEAADIDNDSEITSDDALLVLKEAIGIK